MTFQNSSGKNRFGDCGEVVVMSFNKENAGQCGLTGGVPGAAARGHSTSYPLPPIIANATPRPYPEGDLWNTLL